MPRFIRSRNGIILAWQIIVQKYKTRLCCEKYIYTHHGNCTNIKRCIQGMGNTSVTLVYPQRNKNRKSIHGCSLASFSIFSSSSFFFYDILFEKSPGYRRGKYRWNIREFIRLIAHWRFGCLISNSQYLRKSLFLLYLSTDWLVFPEISLDIFNFAAQIS